MEMIKEISSSASNVLPGSSLSYNIMNHFSRPDTTSKVKYCSLCSNTPVDMPHGMVKNESKQETDSIHGSKKTLRSPTFSIVSISSNPVVNNLKEHEVNLKSQTDTKFVDTKKKNSKKKGKPSKQLRRGKWTVEEEEYVARIINAFNIGYLDAPAGTTLRSYLSEKLHCDPMRITKKFTGESCIGKRIFHPAVRCRENEEAIDKEQRMVKSLEARWLNKMDTLSQSTSRKSIVSDTIPMVSPSNTPFDISLMHHPKAASNPNFAATYTASWLNRATDLLSTNPPQVVNMSVEHTTEVMQELSAVRKLIHEAPIITKKNLANMNTNQVYKARVNIPVATEMEMRKHFLQAQVEKSSMTNPEFGSENFPNQFVASLDDNNPRPHKKTRKAYSTNHLPTMNSNSNHDGDNNLFSTTSSSSTSSLKDAEVLMDFVRCAHESNTPHNGPQQQRRYSLS